MVVMSLLDSVVKRYEDLLKDESIVGSSYTLHAIDMLIPVFVGVS
jgi:hypothetical protein